MATVSFADDPSRVPRAPRSSPRATWVRAIVAHSTAGKLGKLAAGGRASTRDEALARYQANTTRKVSWDFTVDTDGSVAWSNDPLKRYTWHANQVNPYTLGFEIVQEADGTMYEASIKAAAAMVDFLTRALAIQRQYPTRKGAPYAGRIERCDSGRNGRDLVGVVGHRNIWGRNSDGKPTPYRGPGDPNDFLFDALGKRGYEGFDMTEQGGRLPEDVAAWKKRQELVGTPQPERDGVPGPATAKRIAAAGRGSHGVWVARPGD